MSRYFKIVVTPQSGGGTSAAGGAQAQPSNAPSSPMTWTSTGQGGQTNLGAQQIEIDIPVAAYAEPAGPGGGYVRIWGVSLAQISQATNLNNALISVYGGMAKGLPLASAAAGQSGLLASGAVFQAFGNWQGLQQTLDLVFYAQGPTGTQDSPARLSFLWKKGAQLGDMIQQTLTKAYPSLSVNVSIQQNLTLPADEQGAYDTLAQFASYVKNVSQQIGGGSYPGVDIVIKDGAFYVFDGSTQQSPKSINFQDLIGQVTWIDAFTISFNTVMRADVAIGDVVQLPPLAQYQAVSNAQNQALQGRSNAAFQGTWTVNFVRHVGNSRQPDASAWMTCFRAYAPGASSQDMTNPTVATAPARQP